MLAVRLPITVRAGMNLITDAPEESCSTMAYQLSVVCCEVAVAGGQ